LATLDGVLLSGGMDSAMIVAAASRLADRPLQTFTVGFRDGAEVNELAEARMTASLFHTDHHEFLVDQADYQDLLPQNRLAPR
jgi:asparagine synthase (glutamine-hydrolysing)